MSKPFQSISIVNKLALIAALFLAAIGSLAYLSKGAEDVRQSAAASVELARRQGLLNQRLAKEVRAALLGEEVDLAVTQGLLDANLRALLEGEREARAGGAGLGRRLPRSMELETLLEQQLVALDAIEALVKEIASSAPSRREAQALHAQLAQLGARLKSRSQAAQLLVQEQSPSQAERAQGLRFPDRHRQDYQGREESRAVAASEALDQELFHSLLLALFPGTELAGGSGQGAAGVASPTRELAELLQEQLSSYARYVSLSEAYAELAPLEQGFAARLAELSAQGASLHESTEASVASLARRASQAAEEVRFKAALLAAGLMLAGVFLCIALGREILTPLEASLELMSKLKAGDLTVRPGGHGQGELAQLADALGDAVGRAEQSVFAVRRRANGLESNAHDVQAASGHMARAAALQQGALQELCVPLEEVIELASMNLKSAENAQACLEYSAERASHARAGLEQLAGVIDQLRESGSEVHQVIELIESIAMETNLLALNAALGRVKSEAGDAEYSRLSEAVLQLAKRSTQAASSASSLIAEGNSSAGRGHALALQLGEALHAIGEHNRQASSWLGGIASAATEASASLERIKQHMLPLSRSICGNAELTQTLSDRAHSIAEHGGALGTLLAGFQVSEALDPTEPKSGEAQAVARGLAVAQPEPPAALPAELRDDPEPWADLGMFDPEDERLQLP